VHGNHQETLAMTPFNKQVIVHRSVILCLALLATGLFAAGARAEDYTKSFSVANRANVHVDTNDGSVRITTGDTKGVEFHVEYTGLALDKTLHIESHQQGDEVSSPPASSASYPSLWV
jgi:hypothetical protein